jgi:hypothetical protein
VLTNSGDGRRWPDFEGQPRPVGELAGSGFALQQAAAARKAAAAGEGAPRAGAHVGLPFYVGARGAAPLRGGSAMAAWPMGHARARRLSRCGRGRAGASWVGPQARPNPVE